MALTLQKADVINVVNLAHRELTNPSRSWTKRKWRPAPPVAGESTGRSSQEK
jgi:hypothetical protein